MYLFFLNEYNNVLHVYGKCTMCMETRHLLDKKTKKATMKHKEKKKKETKKEINKTKVQRKNGGKPLQKQTKLKRK